MISRLKYKLFPTKGSKHLDVNKIIEQIEEIALNNEPNLAICIQNTGSSYLGVKNATLNLFPKSTIVLPAYYSNILLTEKDFRILSDEIRKYKFKNIVISTLPISMNPFLEILSENENVKVIFHGALSELSNETIEKQLIKMILDTKSGKIKRLGFVKSGLDKWAKHTFGIDCVQLQLNPLKVEQNKLHYDPIQTKIKIGIFGNTSFNKNLHNQIAGALAVENSEIHTTIETEFNKCGFENRIVVHPFLNHPDFIRLLSNMTINLHVSFSEGMGGQIFTESLSLGIPCLTSYNNEYLKFDPYLQNLLTVNQYDNPWEIKKAIERVLKVEKEDLRQKMQGYSKHIEHENKVFLDSFLK
jgi:glycosyltransferase involved in cell wall biosynthesis